MKKTAISAILATQWAVLPEALDTIVSIAEREHEFSGNLQALEAKLGRPLGNTMSASIRDGIALLPVEGPLFKRANLMTEFSGATSYEMVARDLATALDDPNVQAVMLMIDSPGGEVRGTMDLASMVSAASKPVWVHVDGTAASAAYWLASAADRIVASDTSILGSIGAQLGYTARDPRPGERTIRFVSSVSPLKNADPETDVGAKQRQQMVDDLGAVFVASVAANRKVSTEHVLQKFGQGGVMVASKALESGMIDAVGTFESAFESLKEELNAMDYSQLTVASLTEHRKDLVAEIQAAAIAGVEKIDAEKVRAEAVTAERQRIASIEALAVPGTEELVAKFKTDGTEPAAAAVELLKAVKAGNLTAKPATAGSQHIAGLKQTEDGLNPPQAGSGKDGEPSIDDAAKAAVQAARAAGINA